MKRQLIFLTIILQATITLGQTKEQKKTEKWLNKKGIQLNTPKTPEGFERQTDCKGRPIYRKESADTITLITWNGSIAEDLKKFKKTTQEPGFNIYKYPSEVQKNGTVIVNRMSESKFIWRNDTLYLLDTYNEAAAKAQLKLMEDNFAKKISTEEYRRNLESFDESKYPFKPKFKIIYYKGIFKDSYRYKFSKKENFRMESVSLVEMWTENGRTFYEINLDTHTNGRYRFSEDMKYLERNNCRKK
tara:strand:- start:55116 stop:55850 length:735 start_codon:yes stop_codon:yes gene_type:complete